MTRNQFDRPIAVGRTAEIYAWDNNQILKLYRDWCPRDWVDYELKIGRIVEIAGLAVPHIGDIIDIDNRRGISYERIDGVSMLGTFRKNPLSILTLGRTFAELHAAIHSCTAPEDLSSMNLGFAHSVCNAPNLSDDLRDAVLRALDKMPDGNTLCHGDFHPGNVLMTSRGPIIIDWMTAKRGNPLADVARTLFLLTAGPPPSPLERIIVGFARGKFIADYRKRYFDLRPQDDAQLKSWKPIVAAARLNERVPGEESQLLQVVKRVSPT